MTLGVVAVTGLLLALMLAAAEGSEPSVAVFPLRAEVEVRDGVARLMTDAVVEELRRAQRFSRVVTPEEIALSMSAEYQKVITDCARNACSLVDNELAGALGATHILVGSVGRLGETYLVTLKLLELRSAMVVASLTEQLNNTSGDDVLLRAVGPCVARLLAAMLPPRAAPASKAAGPPTPAASPSEAAPSSSRRPLLWGVSGVAGVAALLALALGAAAVATGSAWVGLTWGVTSAPSRMLPVGPLTGNAAVLLRLLG
ncbi:MAG: hypothetical protein AB2A00_43205, partial [Myxococcota bacterium]